MYMRLSLLSLMSPAKLSFIYMEGWRGLIRSRNVFETLLNTPSIAISSLSVSCTICWRTSGGKNGLSSVVPDWSVWLRWGDGEGELGVPASPAGLERAREPKKSEGERERERNRDYNQPSIQSHKPRPTLPTPLNKKAITDRSKVWERARENIRK